MGGQRPALSIVVGALQERPGDVIVANLVVIAQTHGQGVKGIHVTDEKIDGHPGARTVRARRRNPAAVNHDRCERLLDLLRSEADVRAPSRPPDDPHALAIDRAGLGESVA